MAVISEKHNFIFFANPNTASKAIAKTLKEKLEGTRIPTEEIRDGNRILVRAHHSTYTQLVDAGLMTAEKMNSMFKFTGVRNPFDQMVSKYIKDCSRRENDASKYPWLKKAGEGRSLNSGSSANTAQIEFLLWLKLMEIKYIKVNKIENGPLDFLNHADYVIHFEALQEGFSEVLKRIGISEPIQIVEYNVTEGRQEAPKKKRNYQDFYIDESRAIVTKMFAPVIERFGYSFD